MVETSGLPPEADAIEGVPLAREQPDVIGHDDAAATLVESYRSGRMHHAWLVTGPKGIGKATLAFRFARYALSSPDPATAGAAIADVDPRVEAMVARGSHPNLLHLARGLNQSRDRYLTVLSVDEVRRTLPFFGNSSAVRGPRVAIVDAADDMNVNAANALLKMLEEPPPRAIFLVLCHAPGRLLPTIRSRCRRLALDPLGPDDLLAALARLGLEVPPSDRDLLLRMAEGSVRRAVEFLSGNGPALGAAFDALAGAFPSIDRKALHRFADMAAGRKGQDELGLVGELARAWLSDRLRARAGSPATALMPLTTAWGQVGTVLAETEGLGLDRKQAVVEIVQSLADCARG